MDVEGTTPVQPPIFSTHPTTTAAMLQSQSSPPPSPLLSRLSTPQSPSRGTVLRLPGVASIVIKLRRGRQNSSETKGSYPLVSTSGEAKTHPRLAAEGVTSPGKVPLVDEQRFLCKDGVDVKKLLRMIRAGLLEEAQSIGASVLVDEQ